LKESIKCSIAASEEVATYCIRPDGNVHKVALFFYHLHPIEDYKIHFTLKNVSDLHVVAGRGPVVFLARVAHLAE
jgi:hypothetical protein